MRTTYFLALLLALPFLSAKAQYNTSFDPTEAHYLWPTDASHHLTSTFAETRTGHFHAALDIKTWGRRGYKIFATRDGVLHRMAIKPNGYGKVLYLKHEDGAFSIYAHLMKFNDPLQQLADSMRVANNYRPHFDKVVENQNIRIQQGDVIAYSGASGIGPPHLHFEFRTPDQDPYNPLLTNLSVRDDISPQITGLSVEPLSPKSFIEGENSFHTQDPRFRNGKYQFQTVTTSGSVGLGIDVFDRSNGVHNSYGVYELSMSVDGQPRFYARVDSFSYEEDNQIWIDRVYPLLSQHGQTYQRLFVADGNTLPFYQTSNSGGRLHLPPGRHTVEITASDYFGNKSTAVVDLVVRSEVNLPSIQPEPPRAPTKVPDINIDDWNWFANWVTLPQEVFRDITIALPDPWHARFYNSKTSIELKNLDNLFMNIPGYGPLVFHRMVPQHKGLITSVDRKAMATFPRHAFYDTVSVALTAKQYKPDSVKVTVGPEAYPLDKSYKFTVKRDSTLQHTSKLSFYKYNERYDRWYPIDTHFTEEHIIGKTNSLGTFITRRDTMAPELDQPRLSRRPDGQWLVFIGVEDNLSQIDYQRSKILINGKPGFAEYEPEDDRLVYYHPDFEPRSAMNINVVAYDKMGNRVRKQFKLGR
ncbi:M23 family metallopeptidase [Fodinibius salsisoli]|uniref:M23 family metallopeptidase n=1 Tax=Fodinibius salsisoli TaxID=2820877 RepID=A0ABT3PIX8_9BACT|nr:M23 family metallopeptidase [Fodinibius salsisoli]MCW9705886.1 M23 family metallopeptidase [Fodinibius salsisoli]